MIQCQICQKEFLRKCEISLHLSTTHKDSFQNSLEKERFLVYALYGKEEVDNCVEDYLNEKYCVYDLPIKISKYLNLLGVKRTSKEERKTDRYKQKYLKGIQEKYGAEVTNISQIKSVQEKKQETCAKKHGSYEEYLKHHRNLMREGYDEYIGTDDHKEALDKIKSTCLEKYGHENFGVGDVAKEKSKQTKKETIAKWTYEERLYRTSKAREAVCHRGGYSSKPEKRVRKSLIDLDIEAQYNKHMWNYNWDLVLSSNIIIEVQGTMWHAKPGLYEADDLIMGKILAKDIWEKDKRKHKKAVAEGYKVIEIWEDEIKLRNDDQLQTLLQEKLIENEYYN